MVPKVRFHKQVFFQETTEVSIDTQIPKYCNRQWSDCGGATLSWYAVITTKCCKSACHTWIVLCVNLSCNWINEIKKRERQEFLQDSNHDFINRCKGSLFAMPWRWMSTRSVLNAVLTAIQSHWSITRPAIGTGISSCYQSDRFRYDVSNLTQHAQHKQPAACFPLIDSICNVYLVTL